MLVVKVEVEGVGEWESGRGSEGRGEWRSGEDVEGSADATRDSCVGSDPRFGDDRESRSGSGDSGGDCETDAAAVMEVGAMGWSGMGWERGMRC